MTIQEVENSVVEEFSMYEEWLDKYEYLIELGKSLKDYPESAKTDDKLIKGCQSRVWLDYKFDDGKIVFNADSDAIITKGRNHPFHSGNRRINFIQRYVRNTAYRYGY